MIEAEVAGGYILEKRTLYIPDTMSYANHFRDVSSGNFSYTSYEIVKIQEMSEGDLTPRYC